MTAVEFALLAPIVFFLLFATIEMGVAMAKIVALENALGQAARLVYTGQINDRATLENHFCERIPFDADCAKNVAIEMVRQDDFDRAFVDDAPCRDAALPEFQPVTRYDGVRGSQVTLLRVCLSTDLLFPPIGMGDVFSRSESGKFQIVRTTIFITEPF